MPPSGPGPGSPPAGPLDHSAAAPASSPSSALISLLYQLSIVLPDGTHNTSSVVADGPSTAFPLATLHQIEREFLSMTPDRLESTLQHVVYETLRRTGLVLVSAAFHLNQQTPVSHSNLDHNIMSLFMLDMTELMARSPAFGVFVLCSAGSFTADDLRSNVRRWLSNAARSLRLRHWHDTRALLRAQFFYYPFILDVRAPQLWLECEPLLAAPPTAILPALDDVQDYDMDGLSSVGATP